MKRRLTILVFAILVILLLSACGRTPDIVGQWVSEHTSLVFNADGTGLEILGGFDFPFSWEADEGILFFLFSEEADGSIIYGLMQLTLHGSLVESFRYSISDGRETLTISDDHGHGHFNLQFIRVD